MFLEILPPHSLYATPQNVKSNCWWTMTNKLPVNHSRRIPEISGKIASQGSSDFVVLRRRFAKCSSYAAGYCPAEILDVKFLE